MHELIEHADHINELLARYGVKFGIYKNNQFKEQLFPFDAIPRVIAHEEFERLEKGLKQRVQALNLFLKDIYGKKQIVKDGVIPEEFIFISSGYLAECEGAVPPKGIYSHISGIDLVKGKNEEWYILEDNLRVPSGASYPMIARELCRRCSPDTFKKTRLENNRNYAELLRQTMDHVNTGGHNVILTPGRYNAGLGQFTVNIRIIRLNVGADFLVLIREKNSLQLGVGNVLVEGPVDIGFACYIGYLVNGMMCTMCVVCDSPLTVVERVQPQDFPIVCHFKTSR